MVGVAIVVVGAILGVAYAATPHDHVASGCSWWTARSAGEVTPGQSGCVKGYAVAGGNIAEGTGAGDPQLALAYADPSGNPTHTPCPFRPGTAIVVRYHAVFDDGRTIALVDDCR